MSDASAYGLTNRENHRHVEEIGERLSRIAEAAPCDIATIVNTLIELRGLIRGHFVAEENLMEAHHYPYADDHQKSHAAILTELSVAIDDQAAGMGLRDRDLWSFLGSRVDAHVSTYDSDLSSFLTGEDGPFHGRPGV